MSIDERYIDERYKMEKEIKITKEIVEEIYRADKQDFSKIIREIPLGICHTCTPKLNRAVKIAVDEYFLNDLGDVILRGRCVGCNNKLNRYLETGENPRMFKAAKRFLV